MNVSSDRILFHGEEDKLYSYPQKNTRSYCRLCIVMTIIALLGVFLFIAVTPSHSKTSSQETIFVANTVEFNTKIENIHQWTNRSAQIQQWMEFFDDNSNFFSLQNTYPKDLSKIEYKVDISGPAVCNSSYTLHVEEYIDGHKDGLFAVHLKGNSSQREDAFSLPVWPASKYREKSTQRCERDEYQCSNEYTRTSKVLFSQPKEILTCKDVAAIYPRAFILNSTNLQNSVGFESQQIWYSREYSGYLNSDTKFKVSFDMKYPTVGGALDEETVPTKGSWSVRIYSLDSGQQSFFDNEVVKDVTSAWLKVNNHFGDGYCTVVY